jgi:hypothetical protein
MHEKLINSFVKMIDSREATEAAMEEPIRLATHRMRVAVKTGNAIQAAREEGMISAFEEVFRDLSTFASRYRVAQG